MAKNTQATANASSETAVKTNGSRTVKANITFVLPDGTEKNFPQAEATVIKFNIADGTERSVDVSSLSENVKNCAMLQGVVTRFQRSYQAIKELDKVVEAIDETIDDLNNGVWIEMGSGEPRVTMLATAVIRALEENGETVDGERRKSIVAKLGEDEELRKSTRERPIIAAHLADLQLEAAQKRAAEKKALATESGEAFTF